MTKNGTDGENRTLVIGFGDRGTTNIPRPY